MLDARLAFRLPIVIAGMMLAGGRRTAASWFRAAGVRDDWDRFYDLLATVGKGAASLMLPLVILIFKKFDPGSDGYWTVAIDDSPTKRYGRHVEAANIHHNPTPGPGNGDWLYGHNWVCLAMVLSHPLFGVIALPLLSYLYVRKADIEGIKARYGWEFRTKHQLALELCRKVMRTLRALGSLARFVVVFDGAYTMVKLECWDETAERLVDRSDRPWDNPDRRPSHADRRRRLAREMLRESFLGDLQNETDKQKIRQRFEQLLALAA